MKKLDICYVDVQELVELVEHGTNQDYQIIGEADSCHEKTHLAVIVNFVELATILVQNPNKEFMVEYVNVNEVLVFPTNGNIRVDYGQPVNIGNGFQWYGKPSQVMEGLLKGGIKLDENENQKIYHFLEVNNEEVCKCYQKMAKLQVNLEDISLLIGNAEVETIYFQYLESLVNILENAKFQLID